MNQEPGKIKSFTDLDAWKEGHRLVLEVYRITKNFPREEIFGLTNQLRRAVVSFTSNIAEGFSRGSYKEKANFYSIALGSLTEVQNQLIIGRDIKYIGDDEFTKIAQQTIKVSKITNGLIKKTKSIIHNSCFIIPFINIASAGVITDAPSVATVLLNTLNFLLQIFGLFAIIGIVVSAIMYVSAFGDEKQIQTAKKSLSYSIIGIVVALGGMIVVKTLVSFL